MPPFSQFLTDYWHLFIVGSLLLGLLATFIWRFWIPALSLAKELSQAAEALMAIQSRHKAHLIQPDAMLEQIRSEAMSGPILKDLWGEYEKTLHKTRREGDGVGETRIVGLRATALAETFFTEQAVVDTPLKTEFIKHLPGIATGLGIIGTFGGLISGLRGFDVKYDVKNPQKATNQLSHLVESVGHAFYVSAAAIILAMVFTSIEKWLVTARYRQVEDIRELIDSLFEVGAGEEYLKRLVAAAESSNTQAEQMKDTLVGDIKVGLQDLVKDLKEILNDIATKQIASQTQQSVQLPKDVGKAVAESLSGPLGALSGDVSRAISESLSGPMGKISDAVQGTSTKQGEAVNRMLTDVLASFSGQMRDIFGGQMEGLSDLLKQTSESMHKTSIQFDQLATNINAAGTGTVEAMGERLNKALEAMEARQQVMNTQMGTFVEQIRSLVSESQSESSRKLQQVLGAVGEQVAGVVAQLREQAEASAEAQGDRQERFEKSTGQVVGALSTQMEQLLRQAMETNRALQSTVASLAAATEKSISGMNSGAEMLAVASSDFAKAGQGVAETMKASSATVETIRAAAAQLTLATTGTKGILEDYGRTRSTFALMVSELNATIENAKRDASMTSELVGRIEAATEQLSRAQRQSEDYLKGVNEVLIEVHKSFAQKLENMLREGNRQFQGELSSAVQLLSGAIKSLGDVVDDIPSKR